MLVPEVGSRLSCGGDTWSSWAGTQPRRDLFGFDGYRWRRDGVLLAGSPSATYTPTAADKAHRISCEITVTYPLLAVSVSAASPPVVIRRAPLTLKIAASAALKKTRTLQAVGRPTAAWRLSSVRPPVGLQRAQDQHANDEEDDEHDDEGSQDALQSVSGVPVVLRHRDSLPFTLNSSLLLGDYPRRETSPRTLPRGRKRRPHVTEESQAKRVIEVQGNVSALLGKLLEPRGVSTSAERRSANGQ